MVNQNKTNDIVSEIESHISSVDEETNTTPCYSYTALDTFEKCPLNFKYKYVDKMRENVDTLALEIGTLTHKVLEEKFYMTRLNSIDKDHLNSILLKGFRDEREIILGVHDLKKKYFEEWNEPDTNGLTYEDKISIFFTHVLPNEINEKDNEWVPIEAEKGFEFMFNGVKMIGSIDRVDARVRNGKTEYRVVDYKSSKKIYENKDLATAKQMFVYALAVLHIYKTLPTEFLYRFTLIDKKQNAMTPGWEKRGLKKITTLLHDIGECKRTGIWQPKPTPLCHWCSYCATNEKAMKYKDRCPYYLEWTPTNKTFKKHTEWGNNTNKANNTMQPLTNQNKQDEKRKLIF